MKSTARLVTILSSIFLLIATGCAHRDNWIAQYPDDYHPKYAPELVYTYNRDSIVVTGRMILEMSGLYANEHDEVWAADNSGHVYHSNGGKQFTKLKVPIHDQLNVVKGIDEEVWIAGVDGAMLHYKGTVCDREILPGEINDIWGLTVTNDKKSGWAWSNNGTVYQRVDGKWVHIDSITKYRVNAMWTNKNGTECWAVCDSGRMLHHVSGKWDVITLANSREALSHITMSDDGTRGWALSADGFAFVFENGEWCSTQIAGGHPDIIKASADGTECWAAGDRGDVFHFYNNQWHALPVVTDLWAPRDIWFSKQECWIVALKGTYHSSDKTYFSAVDFGDNDKTSSCITANDNTIWIGGWDFNIFRIDRKPAAAYPTLNALRYHLNQPAQDSLCFDFRFSDKGKNIKQTMPEKMWLNVFAPSDSLHPHVLPCLFSVTQADSGMCVCSATLPLDSLGIGHTPGEYHPKLAVSFRTAGGAEVVTYDLKEGNKNYLTVTK